MKTGVVGGFLPRTLSLTKLRTKYLLNLLLLLHISEATASFKRYTPLRLSTSSLNLLADNQTTIPIYFSQEIHPYSFDASFVVS